MNAARRDVRALRSVACTWLETSPGQRRPLHTHAFWPFVLCRAPRAEWGPQSLSVGAQLFARSGAIDALYSTTGAHNPSEWPTPDRAVPGVFGCAMDGVCNDTRVRTPRPNRAALRTGGLAAIAIAGVGVPAVMALGHLSSPQGRSNTRVMDVHRLVTSNESGTCFGSSGALGPWQGFPCGRITPWR